jgi:hypothetical protein
MRPPLVNTWDIVAPPEIHVTIVTLTIPPEGIVTIVAVIVATVTRTATIMAETVIGAIVAALLLLVVVDIPLTIGVAGVTPVAHPLEEAALHLVAEGGQETMIHQPLHPLLQLQLLLLITRGGEIFQTPSSLTGSKHCRVGLDWLRCTVCGMWFFVFVSFYLLISCPFFLSLFFFLFFASHSI